LVRALARHAAREAFEASNAAPRIAHGNAHVTPQAIATNDTGTAS
jgi:hypothetical protein